MHGTIMVFFVAMPFLLGAFGNYLIPLMVGADDMAFPRLNALSFWTLFTASLVLIASMFMPEGPAAAGWTSYAPLSDNPTYTGVYLGQDLWILAVALEFASFLMGGVNFLTTALNLRAPGMSLWRMPMLVWMEITAAVVFLLSVGPLVAGAIMLLLDRRLGTGFFVPDKGGDPLLWEHLFWFFGHPEVYVVALPGFGIMLGVDPGFLTQAVVRLQDDCLLDDRGGPAQLPGVGASYVRFRNRSAPGYSVQHHHDPDLGAVRDFGFLDGRDVCGTARFSLPRRCCSHSAAWPLHHWRSDRHFPGFRRDSISTCMAPTSSSRTFITRYFRLTFFGGIAGHLLLVPQDVRPHDERDPGQGPLLGSFICFNSIFIPLFLVGLAGNPRRIYELSSYDFLKPVQHWHIVATYGAIGLLLVQLPFIFNVFYSMVSGEVAERNPWHANTLEWTLDSPPHHPNFPTPPRVYRDPYEYSLPAMAEDWLPQNQPVAAMINANVARIR